MKDDDQWKLALWFDKSRPPPHARLVDVYRRRRPRATQNLSNSSPPQLYEGKLTEEKPGTDAVLRLSKEAKRRSRHFGCTMLIVYTAVPTRSTPH